MTVCVPCHNIAVGKPEIQCKKAKGEIVLIKFVAHKFTLSFLLLLLGSNYSCFVYVVSNMYFPVSYRSSLCVVSLFLCVVQSVRLFSLLTSRCLFLPRSL